MIIDSTRAILRGRTRFFVVKSFDIGAVQKSIDHSIWSTSVGPTKKLANAFKSADNVVLIFSVNESRGF
jgi:cleavage and polyadenylation specificity factor subunit 4